MSRPPADADNRAGMAVLFDADLMSQVLASKAGVTLFVNEGSIDAYNLLPDGGSEKRVAYVLPDEFGARSGRSGGGGAKSATIVGCGSIGSKVAEALLRSGITSLTLVDGDVFLPGNLERHVLDWNQVGLRKVEALKTRLLSIVPGAIIKPIADNLSWQRSAETHAWQVQAIAAGSIIIDATGDPATALFLGAVADANEKPFVSVEVFEGGIGALVATSLPERDPPFVEGRASFLAWCEERGKMPPQSGPRRYEMISDGIPVVADDAAIEITAGNLRQSGAGYPRRPPTTSIGGVAAPRLQRSVAVRWPWRQYPPRCWGAVALRGEGAPRHRGSLHRQSAFQGMDRCN